MGKGKFIMIDGLDGSGKGTAVSALRDYFGQKGKKIFDLREYWKSTNSIPSLEEVNDYDVICSAEPTFSMVGKVIRDEIVRTNSRKYSGTTTAQAFALDREILYKKLIIPARKAGKIIIQERGITTSLVYQPVQNEKIKLKEIINIPGNQVAIKNSPDLLIITCVQPEIAIKRLKEREKKDKAIFENLVFQRKVQYRFESSWLKKLFSHYHSRIVYLDTNPPLTVENTKEKTIGIWEDTLAKIDS
ncbi:MAG: dTMP kinase [Nanobdellota archaeon]